MSTETHQPRKVHVETWGCQMNTADSERMLAILAEKNYALAASAEEADLVLLNTCHIREKAKHKVLSRLGILKDLKAQKPGMTIAVTGCVAQAEGSRLLKQAPQIDVLLGPGKIDELPRLLDQHAETRKQAMAIGFAKTTRDHAHDHAHDDENERVKTPVLAGKDDISRYVNIQQGCNNYCTFCVVPFTRGREVSRRLPEILEEAKALLAGGAKEITVLGQNVNSYGLDLFAEGEELPRGGPFVELLRQVAALDGLSRLRFTTSNPQDFPQELAELFRDQPKLGRYIHLPVQAGSDRTLERMKRKVTVAEYRERISWLRDAVPDIALSTDLIVGFPGETDEDFEATMRLVEEIRYSFCFSFKYSPRKNTPAARYPDQVPEPVKEARLARLNALQDKITIAQAEAEIGQIRPVLFHYESKKLPGHYYGRTEHFRLVRAKASPGAVGQVLPVKITDANKTALLGDLVT